MRTIFIFFCLVCSLYASAQNTPIGNKNGTVVVQGKLKVDSLSTIAKVKIDSSAVMPADTLRSAPANALAVVDGKLYIKKVNWREASANDSNTIYILRFVVTPDGTGPVNPEIDGYKGPGSTIQDNRLINADVLSFVFNGFEWNIICPTCYNYVSFDKSTGTFDLTAVGGTDPDAGTIRILYRRR